jgi:hypothetical protein
VLFSIGVGLCFGGGSDVEVDISGVRFPTWIDIAVSQVVFAGRIHSSKVPVTVPRALSGFRGMRLCVRSGRRFRRTNKGATFT